MRFTNRCLAALVVTAGLTAAVTAEEKAKAEGGKVQVLKDLAYVDGKAGELQKLDLYLPEGKKDFPVLLFLHGGGFNKGDRSEVAELGNLLAGQGIAVAAAGYRLHPEVKHPSQIQDAAKAFAWVKKNIKAHGGRVDRVFVGGFSAGAYLAALLGTDERYLKAEKLALSDIRGVLALSGPYRLPKGREEIFGDEDARKEASPLTHVKAGLPPFWLAYGSDEPLARAKQTQEFSDAIKAAKGQVEVVEAKDRKHGPLFKNLAAGDPTADALIAFLKKLSPNDPAAPGR